MYHQGMLGASPKSRVGFVLIIVLFVVFIGGAWAASQTILRDVAALWIVSDAIEPADAIAVLGGETDVRPEAAANLYKAGFASEILVSDPKEYPVNAPTAPRPDSELNRGVLLKLGVPASAITIFGSGVSNTYEETLALLAWAKSNGAKSIIIPTDYFTTRRIRWILSREFNASGISFSVDAVPPIRYSLDDWWQHEEGTTTFRNEVKKYLYYRFRY